MNCREAEHHIFAERDGALDEVRRAALATHVSECMACRRLRADLATAIETWRTETAGIRVPDGDREWQKLRRRIHERPTAHRWTVAWIAVPAAAAAAAIAVALHLSPGTVSHDTAVAAPAVAQSASAIAPASTVVYVDDKSGWTFVWSGDGNSGQHI